VTDFSRWARALLPRALRKLAMVSGWLGKEFSAEMPSSACVVCHLTTPGRGSGLLGVGMGVGVGSRPETNVVV
jgi:hypothetical protein